MALFAGLISLSWYEASRPTPLPAVAEGSVRMLGLVVSEPEARGETQSFRVRIETVLEAEREETEALKGEHLRVVRRIYPQFQNGDEVELAGEITPLEGIESQGFRTYLQRQGVIASMEYPEVTVTGYRGQPGVIEAMGNLRRELARALERSMPEPEAALAKGMLLGQRDGIPDDVEEEFNDAGISHLIVISGANVMLVAGFVVGALRSVAGRRQAIVLAMIVVVAYALFVGGSPPVLRAAAMAIVVLGGVLFGRGDFSRGVASPLHSHGLNALLLAGVAMTLIDPQVVNDVSFQLSFAATLGIVLFAGRFEERFDLLLARLPEASARFLSGQLAMTTAASIAVIPIIAVYFGRLSLVSIPANLVAAPLFVLALAGSAFTAVAGVVDGDLGRAAGEFGYLPMALLVSLADFASSLPLASVAVSGHGIPDVLAMYGLVAIILVWLLRRRPREPEEVPVPRVRVSWTGVAAMAVAGAAVVVWWGALSQDNEHLRVTVLDVGQGDAILIETPSGHTILVDGGPNGSILMQALGEALPAAEHDIDLVVLTHAQDDHVAGLVEVMRRYDVAQVMEGPLPGATGAYGEWTKAVEAEGALRHVAKAGQHIDVGDGVRIEVLAPDGRLDGGDLNNNSVVLRLVYGEVSFLLTGDLAEVGEKALLDSGFDLRTTVLKVAHHGSQGSTTEDFLDDVAPAVAVVSSGAGNPFGHPDPSLRLRLGDVPLLRTDLNGSVRFESDGRSVWVMPERGRFEGGVAAAVR
jgi:competence protein ComEC